MATLRPGALRSLRPDARLPAEVRYVFLRTVLAAVAAWASTGLFLAIIPSLMNSAMYVRFAAAGGLSIAVLSVAVTLGGLWAAGFPARIAVLFGAMILTLGSAGRTDEAVRERKRSPAPRSRT